jgi:hypothetical protein
VLGGKAGTFGAAGSSGSLGAAAAAGARGPGGAAATGGARARVAQPRERTTSQLAFRPLGKGVAASVQMSTSLAGKLCKDSRRRLGVS